MALIKCKECQNQVSSKADKCPNCGATIKKKTSGCAALVLIILLVAIIAPIFNAITNDNQPSSSPSPSSSATSPATTPAPPVTAFDMTPIDAEVVYEYYEANEVKADNDLKDKWCLVTGTVSKIGKDITDTPYVVFKSDNDVFTVQCMFSNASEINKLANLSIGQDISIAGICKGKLGNVLFENCQIVSLSKTTGKTHVVIIDN